jgi:hypothetical protein
MKNPVQQADQHAAQMAAEAGRQPGNPAPWGATVADRTAAAEAEYGDSEAGS